MIVIHRVTHFSPGFTAVVCFKQQSIGAAQKANRWGNKLYGIYFFGGTGFFIVRVCPVITVAGHGVFAGPAGGKNMIRFGKTHSFKGNIRPFQQRGPALAAIESFKPLSVLSKYKPVIGVNKMHELNLLTGGDVDIRPGCPAVGGFYQMSVLPADKKGVLIYGKSLVVIYVIGNVVSGYLPVLPAVCGNENRISVPG